MLRYDKGDALARAASVTACSVLMYHAVAEPASSAEAGYCTPPAAFDAQMQWLADSGHTVIPLELLVRAMTGKALLPDRSVVLTFDDGYIDLLESALPTLQRHRFPATAYLVAGKLGQTNVWDSHLGHSSRPLMPPALCREVADAGIAIGSHSMQHKAFSTLPSQTVHRELVDSRRILEDLLGRDVVDFAYPYGRFDRSVLALVQRAGYRSAMSVLPGLNSTRRNPLAIRRVNVAADTGESFARLVRAGSRSRAGVWRGSVKGACWSRFG